MAEKGAKYHINLQLTYKYIRVILQFLKPFTLLPSWNCLSCSYNT
jgi:hypothetical protein